MQHTGCGADAAYGCRAADVAYRCRADVAYRCRTAAVAYVCRADVARV